MKIVLNNVYRMANGEDVLVDGEITVSKMTFFRGTTQRGDSMSFDVRGNVQTLQVPKPGKDIISYADGKDVKNFLIFTPGSLYVTVGQRLWEVVAISRDKKFPIIANELLPDNTFHANIKRFDWEGRAHDGSGTRLHRKVS